MAEFARAGWDYKTLLIGHSVGTWWHQQEPILIHGSKQSGERTTYRNESS